MLHIRYPKCLANVSVRSVASRLSVARLLRGVPPRVRLIVLLGATALVALGGTFLWRYAFPDYPGAVESTRLYAVCQANGAAAEKQYAGQEILVAGTVTEVRRDGRGVCVCLKGSHTLSSESVRCFIVLESEGDAAALRAGSRVAVRGLYSPGLSYVRPTLVGCRLETH